MRIPSRSEWIERAAVLASVKERPGEALEQAVPSECRPSLTAARHDGEGLPSRKASMGTLTYPVLTEIYAAICAPFQDWPSRNTALRITMSFRMTAVTTYLKG